jgi:hypothetical protein
VPVRMSVGGPDRSGAAPDVSAAAGEAIKLDSRLAERFAAPFLALGSSDALSGRLKVTAIVTAAAAVLGAGFALIASR